MSDEMWQVLLAGEITDVDLETLRQWIIEGKVQKADKVRKSGGGSWADAMRTPALRAAFSTASQQAAAAPPPPVIKVESNYAAESAPPVQEQYGEASGGYFDNYDANAQQYAPQEAYSTQPTDNQPYLPPDQPYLPPESDQPYLAPNQTYEAPTPEQPAGTMFQGEAPAAGTVFQGETPKKFLQTEDLPDVFKQNTPKAKRISMEEYAKRMTSQQNMAGLLGAGLLTAFLGAGFWTIFTLITTTDFIFFALGIGYLVGDTCRKYGKCVERSYGITAGIFGMIGAFLGQVLSKAVLLANQQAIPKAKILSSLNVNAAYISVKENFGAFNLFILLAAGYVAYYFSFRTDTEMD